LHFYRNRGEQEGLHFTLPVEIEKRREQKAPEKPEAPLLSSSLL
jgi:hypothetical protein